MLFFGRVPTLALYLYVIGDAGHFFPVCAVSVIVVLFGRGSYLGSVPVCHLVTQVIPVFVVFCLWSVHQLTLETLQDIRVNWL